MGSRSSSNPALRQRLGVSFAALARDRVLRRAEPPRGGGAEARDGAGVDGEEADPAVAQLEEVPRRQVGAAAIVDQDRARPRAGLEVDARERQVALAGQRDQVLAHLQAVDDEPVHHRGLEPPGGVLLPGRHQRQPGPAAIALLGDAGHHEAHERVLEGVGHLVGDDEPDGVHLPGAQHAPLGIGARVAEAPRRGLHARPDLGAYDLRAVEDVRGGPLRHACGLRDVGELG